MSEAVFIPDGNYLVPTAGSIGPWGDLIQGSPAAAALVHAVSRLDLGGPMLPGRMAFDLWRPIPRQPFTLSATILRDGRKAKTVQTAMVMDGVEMARMTAVMLRLEDCDLPGMQACEPPAAPETARPIPAPIKAWSPFFTGVETLTIKGALEKPGPAAAWFRLERPMIAGTLDSPVMRAVSAADLTSGISAMVDLRQWSFVNPELTVHLHRLPEGEWVLNDAETRLERNGTGLASGILCDRVGPFGRCAQSLIVEKR